MRTRTEEQGSETVLVVTGEVDLATVDDLTTGLEEALRASTPGIVVDLSSVSYLDSSGVHALFQVARRWPARTLVIVIPQDSVIRRVLDLVDLGSVMQLCESMEDALSVLRQSV